MNRRHLLGAAAATPWLAALPARAQGANTIRIGVLSDQSGPNRHISGLGSAHAVRLAIQESGLAASGINVEVVQADHQNRSHAGSAVVRQWIDRDGIDVVVDVPGYSVALAVQNLVREKNKVLLNSGASTSELTGKSCSPNTVHWTYDDWMLTRSTGAAMVRAGGESWFVVTADNSFGRSLERDITDSIRIAGGQVLSSVRTPSQGVTNFASFLQQARDSRAQVVALANPGVDTMNFIRQAAASGLTGGGRVKLAGLFAF
ncbi:ABC transporter substrate-binding protein, partial [Rhodovarius sp.]|uniref:ABC transporter substrate-binding protein n=1 Tax=Rhodovarius sp. TaxID=2972673 RepID=UPI00333ECD07